MGHLMKVKSKRFIRFSYIGHSINEIYWFILPLLLPKILSEFGLSYFMAGGLLTVYLVMVSLFSFIIGKLSDYLPRWRILITGFFVTAVCFILAGFTSSLLFLTLFVSIGAIGVSAFHPIAYALLDESMHDHKGRVFGNFECWGMAGAFLMFAFNGILLSFFTWRTVLIISAVPSLVMGSLSLTTSAPDPPARTPAPRNTTANVTPRVFLPLLLFFLTVVLRIISILGVLNFVPTYLMRDLAIEEHIAAFSSGIYFLGAIIGARIGGKAGDAFGHIKILLGTTLLMAPIIALIGTVKIWWLIPFLLLLFGITASSAAPNQNYILSKLSRGMGRGATFGSLVGILTMTNAFSPLIFGASADHFGLAHTIRLFSLPMALSFFVFAGLYAVGIFKSALAAEE